MTLRGIKVHNFDQFVSFHFLLLCHVKALEYIKSGIDNSMYKKLEDIPNYVIKILKIPNTVSHVTSSKTLSSLSSIIVVN